MESLKAVHASILWAFVRIFTAVSYTHLDVYKRQLHLRVDGELLGSVLRDTAELAGIANTVALVALFVRNAAGSGSLLCLAGSSYEPLPVPFLFRGDLDPLLERTVVDLSLIHISFPCFKYTLYML